MGFDPAIIEKARQEREVDLTTFGRTSGKPSRKTLWINTDGTRLFVRSGQGLGRDWPRNVLANGRALLHIAGHDLPVRAVHVTDPALARQVSAISSQKYGTKPFSPVCSLCSLSNWCAFGRASFLTAEKSVSLWLSILQ